MMTNGQSRIEECHNRQSPWLAGRHQSVSAAGGSAVRMRNCRRTLLGFATGLFLAGVSSQAFAQECRTDLDLGTGMHRIEVDVDGDIRTALVHLPASRERVASLPVVIDLHASGITPEIEAQVTGMVDAADSFGFLVALPEARTPFPSGGTTWNVPDSGDGDNEVAFIEALLDRLETSFCIDRDRVFATGFSGGARLASHLACRIPAQFSAIGVVGGLRAPARDLENCASSDPSVRVLAFHSEDDPVNPFHGETDAAPAYWSHGVDDAFSWWARRLGCGSTEKSEIGARITQISASQCAEGAALSLYVLAETGHTWPGSAFPFPEGLGATERELDATAIILDWFGLVPATEREDASRDADG
jgi:polyhydroxybutyrate depolymerase